MVSSDKFTHFLQGPRTVIVIVTRGCIRDNEVTIINRGKFGKYLTQPDYNQQNKRITCAKVMGRKAYVKLHAKTPWTQYSASIDHSNSLLPYLYGFCASYKQILECLKLCDGLYWHLLPLWWPVLTADYNFECCIAIRGVDLWQWNGSSESA